MTNNQLNKHAISDIDKSYHYAGQLKECGQGWEGEEKFI